MNKSSFLLLSFILFNCSNNTTPINIKPFPMQKDFKNEIDIFKYYFSNQCKNIYSGNLNDDFLLEFVVIDTININNFNKLIIYHKEDNIFKILLYVDKHKIYNYKFALPGIIDTQASNGYSLKICTSERIIDDFDNKIISLSPINHPLATDFPEIRWNKKEKLFKLFIF